MRKKIYNMISGSKKDNKWSRFYDVFMIIVIIASLFPLNFKEEIDAFVILDKVCAGIFIIDYLLRWMTADYASDNKPILALLFYPFTFMAIIDLVSILPSAPYVQSYARIASCKSNSIFQKSSNHH